MEMFWELASPPAEGGREGDAMLQGVDWSAPVAAFVAINLGALEVELRPVAIANGVVPRFDDPFTTYRVAGCEVTVYASNYDGAMIRGRELHPALCAWLSARYGIHRYSDPQWRRAEIACQENPDSGLRISGKVGER